jgi:pyruvate/2-oxoglutarate/acetoin dehydrogenase E1 component
MQWEKDYDCIAKFREWILAFNANGLTIADDAHLDEIAKKAKEAVRQAKNDAWKAFTSEIKKDIDGLLPILRSLGQSSEIGTSINAIADELEKAFEPIRKDVLGYARKALRIAIHTQSPSKKSLQEWIQQALEANFERYSSVLYSASAHAATKVSGIAPEYSGDSNMEDGRIILRENYRKLLEKYPEVLVFGEDAGKIGGVNQTLEGLQEQFGEIRVFDTGIRECTIIGQGIGMSMRGLRPIAEIQYLDYLLYAIQVLSDDLATVQYRTKGGQKAPLIISTRGHRLEGIWHSGSPMGMIVNAVRGIHVCVPRNMTKAAGFYNTLLKGDEPAIVVEPLNGYRTKEKMPINIGEFCEPLGVPEVVKEGKDLTVVSYGSTFNLCQQAAQALEELEISVELIDVQTLLPFDVHHLISDSLRKTNRLLIVDEDVSSGASAFILDKIMVEQGGYYHLDSKPITLTAKDHRPAYGTDGDYFSKPSIDAIIETAYSIIQETDPEKFPALY